MNSMPALTGTTTAGSSWLTGTLAREGVGVGGQLIGTYLQSRALGDAADINDRYLRDALDYEKERDAYNRRIAEGLRETDASRYAAYTDRLAPYQATGQSANARMAALLGLGAPPSAKGGSPQPPGRVWPTITTQPVPGNPRVLQASLPAQAMITMQAPNGSTQQVPAADEAHWTQLGARRVA